MMSSIPIQTLLARIKLFFGNKAPQQQKHRSRAGLLLTLALIPLLLGVLACLPFMPVPIGDPEKSRIDPAMSGIWMGYSESSPFIFVLDPYDKRTWLLSFIELDEGQDEESGEIGEPGVNESEPEIPVLQLLHPDYANQIKVADVSLYKTWLTKIKGVTFITWESKTLSETLPEMVPEEWLVLRVRRSGNEVMYLDYFNPEVDGLDEVKTRKEAERIIRRHVHDPEFFLDEINPFLELHKVPASDFETVSRLLGDSRLNE
jgi:hypothetical protein